MSDCHSIITFPPLPPTNNVLTSVERAKLLRTTAKLGRLLGSTPHLLDETRREVPIHVQLPVPRPQKKGRGRFFRKRNQAPESDSEDDSDWQRRRVNTPDSFASTSSRASTSSSSSYVSKVSFDSEESWRVRPSKSLPPLLRLGLSEPVKQPRRKRAGVKPTLETIPASPPCNGSFANDESFSSFPDADTDTAYTPVFNIPTDAALRREKMRRLTKKLGDGVPLHLVFPIVAESDDDEIIISPPMSPVSPTSSDSSSTTLVSEAEISPVSLCFRHEVSHQPPRKSHFAKPLPSVPEEEVAAVRYVVHYDGDVHGRECVGIAL